MATETSISGPHFYQRLSVKDKTRYWNRGAMYLAFRGTGKRRDPNCWRIEWSSGNRRSASGKVLYHSMTVWGTRERVRALLDLILIKPYRPIAEANELIAPYIEWRYGNGGRSRVIVKPVPSTPNTPWRITMQELKRNQIELDYWRMRMIDTLEAYRRYDD